jgi:apolipoprotein N-acyltransferase
MNHSVIAQRLLQLPQWLACLLSSITGALIPLSFSPFNLWPLSIFSLSVIALLITQQSLRNILWRTFFAGLGMYAIGVSWVYVSIHGFGAAPAPLAFLLVAIFVTFLATMFSAAGLVFMHYF